MNDFERRVIERIRESEEARDIVEGFIKDPQCPEDQLRPSGVLETSP